MKTNILSEEQLNYFQSLNPQEIKVDLPGLQKAYADQRHDQSLAIKIFSVLGGLLASIAFIGFLFVANVFDNEGVMLVAGLVFFILAIVLNKVSDQIFLDSISICLYLLGLYMLAVSTETYQLRFSEVCMLLFVLGGISIWFTRSYIVNFTATILMAWALMVISSEYFTERMFYLFLVALALLTCYFLLNESKLLSYSKGMAIRYLPIRTGLMVSFLAALFMSSSRTYYFVEMELIIITSIIFISISMICLYQMLAQQHYRTKTNRLLILIILGISLLATVFSPAIAGTMLLILICFQVNYRTGLALAAIGFIYALGWFYYDMEISLLWKSVLMMGSGVLYLILFFLSNKTLKNHENV